MSDQRPSQGSTLLSKRFILSMYLPALVLSFGSGIIVPVLPVYASSFGVSFGVAATAFIIYQLGSLFMAFPAGYLLDVIGRKPVLIAGPFLMAAAAFLTATADSFTLLLVYRFIAGAAEPLWFESRLAIIADTAVVRERGRQVTWMTGLSRAGALLGPALGGFLAELWGVRVPFIVYGVLVLLAVMPSFKLVQETKHLGRDSIPRDAPTGFRGIAGEFFQPQIMSFMLVSFLANLSRTVFQGGGIALYAVYAYGIGPGVLAILSTVATAVTLPVPFVTGYLMDRFGRKSVIVPVYILTGVTVCVLAATTIGPMPLPFFFAACLAAQMSQSGTSGTMQTLATDLAPPGRRGVFLSVWRVISHAGNTTGPTLIALLAEGVSYAAGFGAIGITAFFTAFVAGVVFTETVERRPKAESKVVV